MTPDEMLAQRVVREAMLMKLDFASGAEWIWTGRGDLVVAGRTWQGVGDVVEVAGLQSSAGYAAHPLDVTLSGVNPRLLAYAQDENEYKNRDFVLWECLFDEAYQPHEPLLFRYAGWMDLLSISKPDDRTRTVKLTVESLWADRGQASYGTYSAADQNRRYPDDRGMDFQAEVVLGVNNLWPYIKHS